jgi:hypothetical protein
VGNAYDKMNLGYLVKFVVFNTQVLKSADENGKSLNNSRSHNPLRSMILSPMAIPGRADFEGVE